MLVIIRKNSKSGIKNSDNPNLNTLGKLYKIGLLEKNLPWKLIILEKVYLEHFQKFIPDFSQTKHVDLIYFQPFIL